MKDAQAIDFLVRKTPTRDLPNGYTGQTASLAKALGITTPNLSMWKSRGIPNAMRPAVLALLKQHGKRLPDSWAFAVPNTAGKTNGGKSKSKKPKGKRPRKAGSQQRRSAGRGGRPLVVKGRGGSSRSRPRSEAAQI